MSADDTGIPDAIVTVGSNALGLRSAALVKRGLALAETVEREFWVDQRVPELDQKLLEGTLTEQERDELLGGHGPVGELWERKLLAGLVRYHEKVMSHPREARQSSQPPQANAYLARFASTCPLCGKPIEAKHYITWSRKGRVYAHHFDCDNPTRIPHNYKAVPMPKDKS